MSHIQRLVLAVLDPGKDEEFAFWQQGWAWSGRAGSVSFGLYWRDTFLLLVFSVFNQWFPILQWSFYVLALVTFHLLEFFLTALYNPRTCTADSFLVNHSTAYTMRRSPVGPSFGSRYELFPSLKGASWNIYLGGLMVVLGQSCRTTAMHVCGKHFHHIVQVQRSKTHQLVTHGLYSVFVTPPILDGFGSALELKFCWVIRSAW